MNKHPNVKRFMHRRALASIGGGGFNPLSLSPDAYYDPNILSSLWTDAGKTTNATVGDAVYWCDDLSGNGRHLQNTVLAARPILRQDLGGRHYLEFASGSQAMGANSPAWGTINDCMVIHGYKEITRQNSSLFTLGETGSRWQSHAPYGDGNLYFDVGGSTAPNRISAAFPNAVNAASVVTFYNSTTDGVQQVWVDGTSLVSDATGHSVTPSGTFWIARAISPTEYTRMDWYGCWIKLATVTTEDRESVEAFYTGALA